ncbi:RNA polymerase subunit sigma-24 [Planctomycetales bacterium 10988]|nr:RNA polymerase subunit sigma-24 [Planctomycetales bacterium 10988]
MSSPSDQQLLVKIANKDTEAFEIFFKRFQSPLLSFSYRMIGDRGEAESITQETFIKVLRHAHRFNPQHKVRPWLYTIAANLCRDHLQKQKRRQTFPLPIEPSEGEAGPFETLMQHDDRERVRAAIDNLPEIYRELIIFRIYERLPYKDIAQIMGIRPGTARCRMEYALNYLRKSLLSPQERKDLEAAKKKRPT